MAEKTLHDKNAAITLRDTLGGSIQYDQLKAKNCTLTALANAAELCLLDALGTPQEDAAFASFRRCVYDVYTCRAQLLRHRMNTDYRNSLSELGLPSPIDAFGTDIEPMVKEALKQAEE